MFDDGELLQKDNHDCGLVFVFNINQLCETKVSIPPPPMVGLTCLRETNFKWDI